jgi:hypothetical protein
MNSTILAIGTAIGIGSNVAIPPATEFYLLKQDGSFLLQQDLGKIIITT